MIATTLTYATRSASVASMPKRIKQALKDSGYKKREVVFVIVSDVSEYGNRIGADGRWGGGSMTRIVPFLNVCRTEEWFMGQECKTSIIATPNELAELFGIQAMEFNADVPPAIFADYLEEHHDNGSKDFQLLIKILRG